MSSPTEGRTSFAPPLPKEARWAIRWVCTNNPFYAISAGLFLAGLQFSYGDPAQAKEVWGLMSGLAGYTLLLACTAYFLVRFASVWDDARTVLLLVVLMFLATSVTFDEVLVLTPDRGLVCCLVGFGFAALVSEGLLQGIGLVLPACYRGPYYLLLALFFLYPPALVLLFDLHDPHSEPVLWGLFSFASIAGLVFLTLIPAIHRGPDDLRANGSPWPWPLYPWTLFGLLALAVPARAVLLCWSMHLIGVGDLDAMIFGFFFLVPFGLALAVLLLEMGLTIGRASVVGTALGIPIGLVILTVLDGRSDPVRDEFLRVFTARIGANPLSFALMASAGFYAYAAWRRVGRAVDALTVALVALAVVGGTPPQADEWDAHRQLPLLATAVLQLGLGAGRRESWRCLVGTLAGIATLTLAQEGDFAPLRALVAFQFTLLGMLVIGAVLDDALARLLRGVGGALALAACVAVMFVPFEPPGGLPTWALVAYPPTMALLLAGYGWLLGHPPSLGVAALVLSCWLAAFGWESYRGLRELIRGLDYLVSSLMLFAVAILVSLGKSGLLPRWFAAWRERKMRSASE